jgi:hypothetical protein
MGTEPVPTSVHAVPLSDTNPEIEFPTLVIRTHLGTAPAAFTEVVTAPEADRVWKTAPFEGVKAM